MGASDVHHCENGRCEGHRYIRNENITVDQESATGIIHKVGGTKQNKKHNKIKPMEV